MKKPARSSSLWDNYKGYFSMVLHAICDAHYNFAAINIGEYRSNNDCSVLLSSRMGRKFEQNRVNIPPPETSDGLDETVSFLLVVDKYFVSKSVSWPIKWGKFLIIDSQELEENTFGILISRSEIFQKPFEGKPELVEKNVLVEMALHNYL